MLTDLSAFSFDLKMTSSVDHVPMASGLPYEAPAVSIPSILT